MLLLTFTRENWQQLLRALLVVLLIAVAVSIVYFVTPLIYPFIIGWLLAYILNPSVSFMERKWKLPRWLAVTVALLVILAIIVTLVTLLITQLVIEIADLTVKMPIYIQQLSDYFSRFLTEDFYLGIVDRFTSFYEDLDENYKTKINEKVGETAETVSSSLTKVVVAFLGGIGAFLGAIPNTVTVLVIAIMAAFFLAKDWTKLVSHSKAIVPSGIQKSGLTVVNDLKSALGGFVKAQFTLISITAVVVIIGLLVLRVDYAFTIGLLTGLVDILPYLGTGLVFVPWIVYLIFVGNMKLAIGLGILYGIIMIARQILEPRILASSVGLDPLLTLIALFVGLQLFGFLGLIIGPVVIVVIMALKKANVFRDIKNFIVGNPK